MTMGVAQSQTQRPGLYLAVLGGRTPQTHVELHDVRWVVGCCIDDTIPELKRQWFGHQKVLHLDSYERIDCVDGYAVVLTQSKSSDTTSDDSQPLRPKLWFVNMGAYDPSSLLELHQIGCVVAPNAQRRKAEPGSDGSTIHYSNTKMISTPLTRWAASMTAYRLWNCRAGQ